MTIEVTSSNAASLGKMLDVETVKELAEAGDIKIKQKNGSARMLGHLIATYGVDAVRSFPRPGSKAKDHGSNVLCDLDKHGDSEKIISWYEVFFTGSSLGSKIMQDIRTHNEAKSTAPDEKVWESEMSALTQRKGAAVSRLKEAIKLNNQLFRVNEDTEAVADLIRNSDNSVIASNKCVFIRDQAMTKYKALSIGQFLGIDVDWAEEQKDGATYENVVKSMKGDGATPQDKYPKIEGTKDFDSWLATGGNYLDAIVQPENDKQYRAQLAALNSAGSDYQLLTMDNMYQRLETFLELPEIKNRLRTLHEAGGMRALQNARRTAA